MSSESTFEFDAENSAFALSASWQAAQFERLVELAKQAAKLEAQKVRVLAGLLFEAEGESAETAVEDGAAGDAVRRHELMVRSLATELAASTRISLRSAQQAFGEAWTLANELHATMAALESGEVGRAQVHEIITETAHLAGRRHAAEAALLPWAKRLAPSPLRSKAKRVLETIEKVPLHERHTRAFAKRHVEIRYVRDGMAHLEAYLDAADAVLIRAGLENAAQEARAAGDVRTSGQLQADFVTAILLDGAVTINAARCADGAAGSQGDMGGCGRNEGRDAPTAQVASLKQRAPISVDVLIPAATLAGKNDEGAIVPGFGAIDPVRARELVALAPSLRRILSDPVTRAIVDFDRATYRVPAELKRVLRLRDGHCRAPGCAAPLRYCEIDHTHPAALGGATALGNLAHLCGNHHHLKHEAGWSLRQHAGAVLEWRGPSGRTYRTFPELDVGVPRVDPWNPPNGGVGPTPFDLPRV